MKNSSQKIQKLSQNQPTYQAYPPLKRIVKDNHDSINVDTVERARRLNVDQTSNTSY